MLLELIEAADFLEMIELKEMCVGQASPLIQPDNVFSWFSLSCEMNLSELLTRCVKIMTWQLHEIKSRQEFLELSSSELSIFFAEADQFDVDPDDLLGASFEWLRADPEFRIEFMEVLLKDIPMEKCSLQCIQEEEDKNGSLIEQNAKVYKLITKALIQIANRKPLREKRSAGKCMIAVGGSKCEQSWTLDSPVALTKLCTTPEENNLFDTSCCATPEGFAVTGGSADSVAAAMFHMESKTWEKLPDLKRYRSHHGSIYVKNRLFVVCGFVGYPNKNGSVHYLDKESGSWKAAPDMPVTAEVLHPESVSTGDDVFVLDTCESKRLFKISIDSMSWEEKAPLPGRTAEGARMISINEDRFCVVGGKKHLLAWYTPSTDTWVHKGARPLHWHKFGAVFHRNNTIMILGGDSHKCESYNMETDVWCRSELKIPGFHDMCAVQY